MGDVLRYKFFLDTMADCYCDLERDPDGDWVGFNEYEQLESELKAAQATIERVRVVANKSVANVYISDLIAGKSQRMNRFADGIRDGIKTAGEQVLAALEKPE